MHAMHLYFSPFCPTPPFCTILYVVWPQRALASAMAPLLAWAGTCWLGPISRSRPSSKNAWVLWAPQNSNLERIGGAVLAFRETPNGRTWQAFRDSRFELLATFLDGPTLNWFWGCWPCWGLRTRRGSVLGRRFTWNESPRKGGNLHHQAELALARPILPADLARGLEMTSLLRSSLWAALTHELSPHVRAPPSPS